MWCEHTNVRSYIRGSWPRVSTPDSVQDPASLPPPTSLYFSVFLRWAHFHSLSPGLLHTLNKGYSKYKGHWQNNYQSFAKNSAGVCSTREPCLFFLIIIIIINSIWLILSRIEIYRHGDVYWTLFAVCECANISILKSQRSPWWHPFLKQ